MSSRFSIVGRATKELPPPLRAWFLDQTPEPVEALCMKPKRIDKYWKVHGAIIVTAFTSAHPGERPAAWWRYDAPRWLDDPWPGKYFHGTFAQPRVRTGGTGIEVHEELRGYAPSYSHGISSRFIHCDADDLPRFESTPTYLRRHNLFLSGEEERLPADAYDDEELDPSRIMQLRSMDDLNAEHAARKAAGTLGQHDPRFDK